jgi:hypothetical protein
LRYTKKLQTFWEEVIKECRKENLVPATTVASLPKRTIKISSKDSSETLDIERINFCYDIFHELENKSYSHLFYKCVKKNVIHPIDLFTIKSKLENNQYTRLEEFEKDVRLMFRNCYTYNDASSKIYHSTEALESIFNEKWNEKLVLHDRETRELKRLRDNDSDTDLISKLLYYIFNIFFLHLFC